MAYPEFVSLSGGGGSKSRKSKWLVKVGASMGVNPTRPAKSPGISGSLQKSGVISRSPGMVKKTPGTEGICRSRPKCVPLLTNIAATTPPLPPNRRRLLRIPEKFCYYLPPPPNRVGLWRSRKRLKKFNDLNLAALPHWLQKPWPGGGVSGQPENPPGYATGTSVNWLDTNLAGTERENMLVSKKRKHNRFLPLFSCQIANQKHLACWRLLRQCSVARIAQTPFLKGAETVE